MRWFGIVVLLAFPTVAAAQTSTTDAIQALATGDYGTAQALLKAQVESANPDPLAQFFQAAMVFSGVGERVSVIRSCGLFTRADVPTNPLAPQAATLVRAIHHFVPVIMDLCSAALTGQWSDDRPDRDSAGRRRLGLRSVARPRRS